MKRQFSFAVALILIIGMAQTTLACSSFVVYGQNGPIFGMNWDMPSYSEVTTSQIGFFENHNARVVISKNTGLKVFGLFSHDLFYNTFYNEFGVFAAAQTAYPSKTLNITRRERRPTNSIGFMNSMVFSQKAGDVMERLDKLRLIQANTHFLCADPWGSAFIAEAGVEQNHVVSIDGNYIIMTNFLNHLWENASLALRESLDFDQRYRIAQHMIETSFDGFGYREGLSVLAGTKQRTTKFSVVVVPKEQHIYFTLFGDFSRIWQVDFEEETIATYQGFKEQRVEPLDEKGFTLYELMEWS